MSEIALSDALSSNYMLTSLNVRIWSATKTDREASKELTESKGAASNAARVVKQLLAGNDAKLKDCQAAFTRVRTWHYANTLNWNSDKGGRGDRLVATSKVMDFLGEFKRLNDEAVTALTEFLDDYEDATHRSATALGQLHKQAEYPSRNEVEDLFGLHLDVKPLPAVADFDRVQIPGKLAEGLKGIYAKQAEAQIESAYADMHKRFAHELSRMAEQLGKVAAGEKTRLFKSLVGNVRHLVDLGRSMNLTSSQEFDDFLTDVEGKLCKHEIDAYKDNVTLASQVAKDAKALHGQIDAAITTASSTSEASSEVAEEEPAVSDKDAMPPTEATFPGSIPENAKKGISDWNEEDMFF